MLGDQNHLRSSARATLLTVASISLLGAFAACSPAKWHEPKAVQEAPAPFTGDPRAEVQTTNNRPQDFTPGETGWVNSDRLCVKTTAKPTEECPSVIEQGDRLRVKNPNPEGHPGLVEVEVESSKRDDAPLAPVLVPPQYLSKKPIQLTAEDSAADRYFVVQNIATEKLRVYENCHGKTCNHRLVFETDMVVGQDTPSRRSLLGSYTITKWFKFYEDNKNQYASWWNVSGQPQLPGADASLADWTSPALLPAESKGKLRGAFGWYTAFIGPNAGEQWTHGTWGWGADQDKFIQELLTTPAGNDALLASHGCTRVENQAIALMRAILPPGTKLIKVYARETSSPTEEEKAQPVTWDWALTSDGVDELNGSSADLAKSQATGTGQVLEQGKYLLDTTPTPVVGSETSRVGNAYGIPQSSFKGVFNVDQGRLVNYRHPRELQVGGTKDKHLPSVVLKAR